MERFNQVEGNGPVATSGLAGATDPVAKAIAYVEADLGRPLTLAEVAAHVGYSPFHFHRLFAAVTGETLGAFIRRRRLAEAAKLLAEGSGTVLDVALELDYQSQEALTRSFKRATGLTPGAYRRAWRSGGPPQPGTGGPMMESKLEPKFVDKGKVYVVGMAYYGENKGNEIEDIPANMVGKTLPASKYAVFALRDALVGGNEKLGEACRYIYGTWLPASGYVLAAPYDFEAYGEEFNPEDDSGVMYIYIPVKKKAG